MFGMERDGLSNDNLEVLEHEVSKYSQTSFSFTLDDFWTSQKKINQHFFKNEIRF